MHVVGQTDPGPESDDFNRHVYCEHGGLTLSTTSRRRISAEVRILIYLFDGSALTIFIEQASHYLQDLFPYWNPLSDHTEECALCEAIIQLSREEKQELRKQSETEKVCFESLHM